MRSGEGGRPKAAGERGFSVETRKSGSVRMQRLVCERCGYVEELELAPDDVTATPSRYLAPPAGLPVLCSGCASEEQAAEEFYRSCGSD